MVDIQGRDKKFLEGFFRPPPDPFFPESGEVHLWWVSLNTEIEHLKYLYQILSINERKKAERFYFRKDREYFLVSHGILRVLLAWYLQKEPGDLRFTSNRFGKPRLETSLGVFRPFFNLSHSHGLALYAISDSREVGVDLEYIDAGINTEEFSETFFTPREIREIHKNSSSQRKESLLQYWTFKEAYLKAIGQGHSRPLDTFEISFFLNQPEVLLKTGNDWGRDSSWSAYRLDAPQDCLAALVVEGRDDLKLVNHQWETARGNHKSPEERNALFRNGFTEHEGF
jgi:4'-phosphopantetheinyl transferase